MNRYGIERQIIGGFMEASDTLHGWIIPCVAAHQSPFWAPRDVWVPSGGAVGSLFSPPRNAVCSWASVLELQHWHNFSDTIWTCHKGEVGGAVSSWIQKETCWQQMLVDGESGLGERGSPGMGPCLFCALEPSTACSCTSILCQLEY